MALNPAYLIECTLYEKCFKEANNENYVDYMSEFQRVFPQLFKGPFTITSEIEGLDKHRKALARALDEIDDEDIERYNDTEDAVWYTYRYEVNAFYEANKPTLDAIIDHYKQFLNEDGKKEDVMFKIVRTPAGYWLATKYQSWLLAKYPFQVTYTCKALGVYLYRWIKSVWREVSVSRKRIGLLRL